MGGRRDVPPPLPTHWTPEQALAVFECLHALREQLWALYGSAVQQAWCEQLAPQLPLPEFDDKNCVRTDPDARKTAL